MQRPGGVAVLLVLGSLLAGATAEDGLPKSNRTVPRNVTITASEKPTTQLSSSLKGMGA